MRQAGFYFYFLFLISPKTDEATFLFDQNTMRHLSFVHFKHKNADILILTFEKNESGHFFYSSLEKRQMRGI